MQRAPMRQFGNKSERVGGRVHKSKIDGALIMQQSEVAEEVVGDALRLGFGIERVEFFGDLLDGVFAVAKLHNFEARAVETQSTLRHQQHARLLRFFIQAHAGSKARRGGEFRLHHDSLAGWKAPGGGQPGFTYAK